MQIFISHSSRDREEALALKEMVEAEGHSAWFDIFDIEPAARLAQAIRNGVKRADAIILLLSPSAMASPWVATEIQLAVDGIDRDLRIVPMLLRSCLIPEALTDIVAIDASRGMDSPVLKYQVFKFLGGDTSGGMLLDAAKRMEIADRAIREAAERRFPDLEADLERVLDQPLRDLRLEIDQNTWPLKDAGALELRLSIDITLGAASIFIAPYVEGDTWAPLGGKLDERPPSDFFASEKARVDARFLWGGHEETLTANLDGTDLGEQPLSLTLALDGRKVDGAERAVTLQLIQTVELPPLRKLIDDGSSFHLWDRSRGEPVAISGTDIDMRLMASVESDALPEVCLWRSRHDAEERALLQSQRLLGLDSQIHREILLAAYRKKALRFTATSTARRARLARAIDAKEDVPGEDRWAAFHMLVSRAHLAAYRNQSLEAANLYARALDLSRDAPVDAQLVYARFFTVWSVVMRLFELLRPGGFAQASLIDQAVGMAREMRALHPTEGDYTRAASRALLYRAGVAGRRDEEVAADLDESVRLLAELATTRPSLPWRHTEAAEGEERANARRPKAVAPAPPVVIPPYSRWLDPRTRPRSSSPLLVSARLPQFHCFVASDLGLGPAARNFVDEELLFLMHASETGAWFSVGCREARSSQDSPWSPEDFLAHAPFSVVSSSAPELIEAATADLADLPERLRARELQAVRLHLAADGSERWAYVLRATFFDLIWTVGLCVPRDSKLAPDVATADRLAAITFAGKRLPFEPDLPKRATRPENRVSTP